MKKKILLLSILTFLFLNSFSQCLDFTTKTVVPKLGDFLLTGKYHSLKLAEGDEILILKTLNKGLIYRFVVMGEKTISKPQFIILDWNNKVIFDNEENNFVDYFDYKCKLTERIKIVIKVPELSTNTHKVSEGCVSLVMGIKS